MGVQNPTTDVKVHEVTLNGDKRLREGSNKSQRIKQDKRKKDRKSLKWRGKGANTGNVICESGLMLDDELDETDTDMCDLDNPLYLEGEEVEIGTSEMISDPENSSHISFSYSKLCTSIDLDHSSYSGNVGSAFDGSTTIRKLVQQQEVEVSVQGSQFTAQGVFSAAGVDESEGVNLLEFVNTDQSESIAELKEGRVVVLGEEGADLGILSQFEGDSVHAVMVGDYEYGNEVIVDQC